MSMVAEQSQQQSEEGPTVPWELHPFGSSLVSRFIGHYLRSRDVQTLAVLTSVLCVYQQHPTDPCHWQVLKQTKSSRSTGIQPIVVHMIHPRFHDAANNWRYEYAKYLHTFGLFQQHAEVLKFVDPEWFGDDIPTFPKLMSTCNMCNVAIESGTACAICRLPIRGATFVCFKCGHMGHLDHMVDWFALEDSCPHPGCDCRCKLAGNYNTEV